VRCNASSSLFFHCRKHGETEKLGKHKKLLGVCRNLNFENFHFFLKRKVPSFDFEPEVGALEVEKI
jgi:hypothetical protein